MKFLFVTAVVALTTALFVSAGDPDCENRKLKGLALHWPNPSDCSRFYRCNSKSIKREITCPAEREYNPKTGKCAAVGKGLCKLSLLAPLVSADNICNDEVSGLNLPKTGDCREFYICNNGVAYEQTCDAGSYFNATSGNCLPDTDNVCWQNKCINEKDGTFLAADSTCLGFYICTGKNAIAQTCSSGSYFDKSSNNCIPDVNSANCWENFCLKRPDGEQLADPSDCHNYYICNNNITEPMQCPTSSYFDETTMQCETGECPAIDITTTEVPPTDETTPETESDCTCVGGYQQGEMVPHPNNCQLFYICYEGELIEQNCTAGNYFDCEKKICARDTEGVCAASATHIAKRSVEDCCPGGYVEGENVPHGTDCDKYYVCENSVLQPLSCVYGYRFDTTASKCVPDTDGICWPKTGDDCTCPGGIEAGSMVPYPEECRMYYLCANSVLVSGDCGQGNRFDSTLQKCVADPTGQCQDVSNICKNQPDNVMMPNIYNCSSYYLCLNGESTPGSCSDNDMFDPAEGMCTPDLTATCRNPCANVNGISFMPHPTCTKYYFCNAGTTTVESCEAGQFFDHTLRICLPGTCKSDQCEGLEDGTTFPVAGDDTKFVYCYNGVSIERSCNPDTQFDPVMKICKPIPSTECDQSLCTKAPDGQINPTLCGSNGFCVCRGGSAFKEDCPDGYNFDNTKLICYSDAPCDPAMCLSSPDYTVFWNRNSTTSFCMCLSHEALVLNCINDYTFNPVDLHCQAPVVQDPNCDQSLCLTAAPFTIFPSLSDDTTFCVCIDGGAQLRHCEPGQTFTEKNVCELTGSDSICDINQCTPGVVSQFPTPTDPKAFCYCDGSTVKLINCPTDYVYNVDLNMCQQQPCDKSVCLDASNAGNNFPANNNPYMFCHCNGNQTKLDSCNKDYIFDPVLNICVSESNPNCDIPLCVNATADNQYSIPAINDPNGFCWCSNFDTAVKHECSTGLTYDIGKGICVVATLLECDITLCANSCGGNAYATPAIDDPNGFCWCSTPDLVTKYSCPAGEHFDEKSGNCLAEVLCEGKYQQFQSVVNDAACNKYYLCYDGTLLDLTCGDGLYFDSTQMKCLPNDNGQCVQTPQDADCTCPGGYQNGQFVPHPTDCQLFYICSGGQLTEADCGVGNYYNQTLGFCTLDTNGACKPIAECTCPGGYNEGDMLPNPTDTQLFYICYNGELQLNNCGAGSVFDSNKLSCVKISSRKEHKIESNLHEKRSVDVVPEEDSDCTIGDKRSVPSNCSQFEICVNGARWNRTTCAEHLYYNPERQLCMEPRDDTVCAYARVSGLPTCNEAREHQLAPSRNQNCGAYLRCTRGKWRLKNCAKTKLFSLKLRTCIVSNDTSICQQQQSSTSLENDSSSNNTVIATQKCRHTQVRAYERNCAMYYMCLEGEWWFQYCPLGMYFNREHNYCVPNDAGQCASAELRPQQEQQLEVQPCTKEGAVRASAVHCAQYYACLKGVWQQQLCAAPNYFNVTLGICAPDVEDSCWANAATVTSCVTGGKRSFPLNCAAYERCNEQGVWLRADCAQAQTYDDVINECVPNDGECSRNGLRRACRDGETKAHPLSMHCDEFYYCDAGNWQVGGCLKGYAYSPLPAACVLADKDGGNVCLQSKEQHLAVNVSTTVEENPCVGQAEGVSVPHANDCSKFYMCLGDSSSKLQNCNSGSFYDTELRYCRPNDGSCKLPLTGPCEGQTDGALVQHPTDCTAFYKCSTQSGTLLYQCAEGEYYHNFTRQCRQDHGECRTQPTRSICAEQAHGARLPHEKYCNIYYACVRSVAVPIECPDAHKFNEVLRRCLPDEERVCQNGILVGGGSNATHNCGKLDDGSYVPDKSDCTWYYICSSGMALHKQCAAGSYFDAEQGLCVPDDGSCPFVDSDKPNHQPVPPDPIVCIGRHGDLMPDPLNCNEFYVCINGNLRHERCYEGQFFNATSYQCVAYQTGNDSNIGGGDVVAPPNSTQIKNTVVAQCQDQPTNMSTLCTALADGVSMAEPHDCRRYIVCEEQLAIAQRCRNGESYDSLLGFCRQNDGTCMLENGQRVGVCNEKHGQLARDVENCRGYFVCVNGQRIAATCAEDEYFSKSQNMCLRDEQLTCNPSAKTEDIFTSVTGVSCIGLRDSTYYPHVLDQCHSYFQCIKGVPKLFECANGWQFDSSLSRCVSSKVECVMPSSLQANKRIPDEKICTTATLGQRFANKDDHCRSYFICLNEDHLSYETCPIGTLFNVKTNICDEADKVVC